MRFLASAAVAAWMVAVGPIVCLGQVEDGRREADRFFESQVRPLFVERCVKCHGPEQQKGGLRLDVPDAVRVGGDSGPPVEPGHPDESLLIEAIHYDGLKMPPTGRLSEPEIQVLERWVAEGAHWPSRGAETGGMIAIRMGGAEFSEAERAWWAFQPVRRSELPDLARRAWGHGAIDRFVGASLESAGLTPAAEADRRTLIRRLSFDLTGLPPAPEEVARFEADESPGAYERLVDAMLASPRYGERWGRHWLDLVRYAETDGYKADAYRPEAWRYRDWVIDALNGDMPYDRFLTEQLAGDELDPGDPRLRVATSFLRLWAFEYNQRDVEGQWANILNDMTDVTADVVLGLGMGCARCHDHKFDPIRQEDYFRLQAFFAPMIPRDDLVVADAASERDRIVRESAWHLLTADLRSEIAEIERPYARKAASDALAKFQPHLKAILAKPPGERSPRERQIAYFMERQLVEEFGKIDDLVKGKDKDLRDGLKRRLARYDAYRPPSPARALTATDVGAEAPEVVIPGDRKGQPVAPGYLSILEPETAEIGRPAAGSASTGRRLTLARWLTSRDHPLVPRVIVNRLWQYHFGRGLVATASDFGTLGELPSHPELLDWLAAELVDGGWSLKHLHRAIVLSATYRQGRANPAMAVAARRIDPENRLLWERQPRRLEAEPLRDAMLWASGELQALGHVPDAPALAPRRSIYTRLSRNQPDGFLSVFDGPDGSSSLPLRNVTTTATQALLLVNGAWTLDRAGRFAARLEAERPGSFVERVERGFWLALARPPTRDELIESVAFVKQQAKTFEAEPGGTRAPAEVQRAALLDFCHALLNTNAFLYVD
jgi:hypothetical protein